MIKSIHLYWYSLQRNDRKENYGDVLGPYIVSKISGRRVIRAKNLSSIRYRYFIKHYFTIGSIIKRTKINSIVWGSGIINKVENVKGSKFLAVRGPITRARLMELGYEVPEKYGDPSMLLTKYINYNHKIKYEIGIIPHYADYFLFKELFLNDSRIKVLDLLTTDVEKTTNEILMCKNIISSSLHGLIVPQAYKIPALWVRFSDSLSGDDSKFHDYFLSVGIKYSNAIIVSPKNFNYDTFQNLLNLNVDLLLPNEELFQERIRDLEETCPFKN